MLNTTNKEFLSIEEWFTDQNSKQLYIEDNVNSCVDITKQRYSTEPKYRKIVEVYGFFFH